LNGIVAWRMRLRQPLYRWLAALGIFVLALWLLWVIWQPTWDSTRLQVLWQSMTDQQQLQRFVDQLGWFGPLALILLNATQIIVAPIPGYIIQAAAGYLYGPLWGGVWASLGLFLGAMSAMKLARLYGRPLVERLVGAGRLAQWEGVTHSNSPLVWSVLLVGPTGDLPYHLAGLSRISFSVIALITLCIRVPSVFVAAAVGAGVVTLPWWQFVLVVTILAVLVLLFIRYQTQITGWFDQQIQERIRN
jgi:uncharacterized membrane protein YdjX (TVP38/TMEM64 family)